MGIKPMFNMSDVRKRFDRVLKAIEEAQIEGLSNLGERCVAHAIAIPEDIGYGDVTGALRSSTGYMVFKDGVAVRQDFKAVEPKDSKAISKAEEGIAAGKSLAEEVGSQTKGIVLVVVAGMNYATYVEAKGRDVLSSAEILAQRELPKELQVLIDDIKISLK